MTVVHLPRIIFAPGTTVRKRQYWDHSLPPRVGEIAGRPVRDRNNWYYPIRWNNSQRVEKVMAQRLELIP